jgi:hypothetical protein
MPAIVNCDKCGAAQSIADVGAGKFVLCSRPGCGNIIAVHALIPSEEIKVVEAALEPPPVEAQSNLIEAEVVGKTEINPVENGNVSGEHNHEKKLRPRRRIRRYQEIEDPALAPKKPKRKRSLLGGTIVAVVTAVFLALGGTVYIIYLLVDALRASMSR